MSIWGELFRCWLYGVVFTAFWCWYHERTRPGYRWDGKTAQFDLSGFLRIGNVIWGVLSAAAWPITIPVLMAGEFWRAPGDER